MRSEQVLPLLMQFQVTESTPELPMITVTPEQRQKMVDAYHSYMKKHK